MDKLQEIREDKHELQKSINKLISEFANKYNDVLLDVDVRLTSTKGSTGKTAIVGINTIVNVNI